MLLPRYKILCWSNNAFFAAFLHLFYFIIRFLFTFFTKLQYMMLIRVHLETFIKDTKFFQNNQQGIYFKHFKQWAGYTVLSR